MADRAIDGGRSVDEWGPVRRGFAVWLADGRRGAVADIRLVRGGGVELLVVTGLFFRSVVTVPAGEVEAILPRERRIVVGPPTDACQEPREAADGELVRLPVKQSASDDPPSGHPRGRSRTA